MKVCVITDNLFIFEKFTELLKEREEGTDQFDFYYTSWNESLKKRFEKDSSMKPILLKQAEDSFFDAYDLFISLHCKQIFPKKMVEEHTCINVHPGLNPYNRGWFPQVFGIINKLPIGVTIHFMDQELDHGPILYQKRIELREDDTSLDVYDRILDTEIELLRLHLDEILAGTYEAVPMESEGNINLKKDFDALCELDLDKTATYREVIDHLRALTHAPYNNAYFFDRDGNKVYIGVSLKKEEK